MAQTRRVKEPCSANVYRSNARSCLDTGGPPIGRLQRISGGALALVTQDTKSLFYLSTPRAKARALSGGALAVAIPLVILVSAGMGMASFQLWRNNQADAASRGQAFADAARSGYVAAVAHTAAKPKLRLSHQAADLDCLASAVYYEARGESLAGQAAVAQVVLNRARHPNFPKSVCGVVFQSVDDSCQFSFVCNGAMDRPREVSAWRQARAVATRALQGYVMRTVGEAISFHVASLGSQSVGAARIGSHVFFGAAPRAAPAMVAAAADVSAPTATADPAIAGD